MKNTMQQHLDALELALHQLRELPGEFDDDTLGELSGLAAQVKGESDTLRLRRALVGES